MTQGTYGLTFEVSNAKTPSESELDGVVKRSVDGAMAFVQAIADSAEGKLKIERAPHLSLVDSRNPLWVALGMKLE
jgi:hypothetical protein